MASAPADSAGAGAAATAQPAPAAAAAANDGKAADSDDDEETETLQYKMVVLGDGAVGKTSICNRFAKDSFAKQYKQTVGVDFFLKRLVLPGEKGDVHITMSILDIGGQSIGSKMITKYIYGAQAVLLCYDVTNVPSFQNLDDWLAIVRQTFEKDNMPYCALVGNKMDLIHLRTVKDDKHVQYATDHGLHPYLISAKQGDGLTQSFYKIAADLAGIALSKAQLESAVRVVKADIVDYQKDDASQAPLQLKQEKRPCIIM